MKTLKAILLNILFYVVVTVVVVGGLELHVYLAERSAEESLWKTYTVELEEYVEQKYSSLPPLLRYFKRGEVKKEFNRIFVEKYGEIPEKTSPAKAAEKQKKRYLRFYYYLVTPLWILISFLVFFIRRGLFRARIIITLIAAAWIILTIYLPALSGQELRLVNTLVLILVPAGIAWAIIRLFERKSS
jgi:hypothetical protein